MKPTSSPEASLPTFALITPARNEEALIEGALRSVVAQSVRPVRWIIVNDGSTDATEQICRRYAAEYDWIEVLNMPVGRDRSFAAKAVCFNTAYEKIKGRQFDLIGNLDADITFDSDYYEFLLARFAEFPRLGVAGTPFVEDAARVDDHTYSHKFADHSHVSGACQLFRRACFDEIGGYTPIKGGGIDWVAVTTARMNGWQTRTFTEKVCFHHRKMGTANRSPAMARFRHGREDYYVGGHPLWQIFRGVFQMRNKPFVVGGLFLILGYFWAMLSRAPRVVSRELMEFHRREQMARFRRLLRR